MKRIILTTVAALGIAFASEGFNQMCDVDGMQFKISSTNQLSEGNNKLHIQMMNETKDNNIKNMKDVRIKFFMPEMPGMPYMESKNICNAVENEFQCDVNLPMGGTWQYMMYVTDKNDVKHKYKNSLNLGGSNMSGMDHGNMDHSKMNHGSMDHSKMGH